MYEYQKRQEAKETIAELVAHQENVLIIHYSCESLSDKQDGSSARVTSIAVQYMKTKETRSFSLHHFAEIRGVKRDALEGKLDSLEKELLAAFYEFVDRHPNFKWAHWNMRNTIFGFPALEHRFRVLGGKPTPIPAERLVDIGRLMPARYGNKYIGNPRLEKLVLLNEITNLDFLLGPDEAKAFASREFVRMHKSTLRKVGCIGTIVDMAASGKLKTESSWDDRHGYSWSALPYIWKEHPIAITLGAIVGLIGLVASVMGIFGATIGSCGRSQ